MACEFMGGLTHDGEYFAADNDICFHNICALFYRLMMQ